MLLILALERERHWIWVQSQYVLQSELQDTQEKPVSNKKKGKKRKVKNKTTNHKPNQNQNLHQASYSVENCKSGVCCISFTQRSLCVSHIGKEEEDGIIKIHIFKEAQSRASKVAQWVNTLIPGGWRTEFGNTGWRESMEVVLEPLHEHWHAHTCAACTHMCSANVYTENNFVP